MFSKSLLPKLAHSIALILVSLLPLLLAVSRAGADIACVLIDVLFMAHCAVRKEWGWFRRPEFCILWAMWGYMLLTSALAQHPGASVITALIWGRFILFIIAVSVWIFDTPRTLITVGRINALILALVMIDGGWQYVTGMSLSGRPMWSEYRITGPLSHPTIGTFLGKIGLPTIGLLFYDAVSRKDRRMFALSAVFSIAWLVLVILSGERTVAVLTLLALAVMGCIVFLQQPHTRKYVLYGSAAITLLLIVLFATQATVQQRSHDLVEHLTHFRHSPYGQIYSEAFMLWSQHPVMGIGAGEFRYLCPSVMPALGNDYCDIHPHNTYLEWLTDGGIIGFVFFVCSMALLIRRLLRQASFKGSASIPPLFAIGTLVALLFPFAVTQSMFANWAAILFWYSLSMAINLPKCVIAEAAA